MIDTHCHLLPGVDDGPPSTAEALELAHRLVEDDVELVLCTPHYSRLYATDHRVALEVASAFRKSLADAQVPLRLLVAAEVSPLFALTAEPADLLSRSVGGRSLLVELESDIAVPTIGTICKRVDELGLTPILAHPERCRAVRRDFRALDTVRGRGALVQVVASSLLGEWGADVGAAAWALLDTGRADLLASDAHGRRSPPRLGRAAERVAARLGSSVAEALTVTGPAAVVAGITESESGPAQPDSPSQRGRL